MPYRRLPNTDAARIRAINTALYVIETMDDKDVPFNFAIQQKLSFFKPKFELAVSNYKHSKAKQIESSKQYLKKEKKARLYVSHFIQALNMCIAREEMKTDCRTFFGIDINDKSTPDMQTASKLLEWGNKVIDGESKRIQNGGNPIYTPSFANVKTNFSIFKNEYFSQKQFQKNTLRFTQAVAELRSEADALIKCLWNEIEEFYSNIEEDELRREKCSRFGIKYVLRRYEKNKK